MFERILGGFCMLYGGALILSRQFDLWVPSASPPSSTAALALFVAGWALWNTARRGE